MILFLKTEAIHLKKVDGHPFFLHNRINSLRQLDLLKTEMLQDLRPKQAAGGLICRTLAYNLGMHYTAGLIPMPYGENNYSKQLVNVVIDALNRGESPRFVEGNNLYDLVYIQDIAEALFAIGEKGHDQKEYYVGHRKLKTFREWMIEIRDVIAPDVALKFGEYQDLQQIDYSQIDLDALYRDTGWECRYELKDRIAAAAQWVKQYG